MKARFIPILLLGILCAGCVHQPHVVIKNSISYEPGVREVVSKASDAGQPAIFVVGEELRYTVRWFGIPVGTIVSRVEGIEPVNGRPCYVVRLRARTNGFCSRIYRIDDEFVSCIDTEKICSRKHIVHRREGRFRKDATTLFDGTVRKAFFYNRVDGSRKEFEIPAEVQDPLSALYYFRTLAVRVGDEPFCAVVNNEKVYDVWARVRSRKSLIIDNDRQYRTFFVEPYAKSEGRPVKKGRAVGYVSADGFRVPVLGVVKAPVFTKVTVLLNERKMLTNGR